MIEVEGLTKYYGNHVAIRDVTFSVNKGEVLGFLGPNGAGKTTTMRIITGYLMPSAGKAYVGGHDVEKEPVEVKRLVGYLPENPPVYVDMTVRDYLFFVAALKQVPSSERRSAVARAVEACGLASVYDRLIGNLSRGFKQRVGIAQAIVHSPEVLILDEPTIGLDPAQVIEIRALIKELGKEHTVILSTHILPEVLVTCDRVLIINEGRLVAADTYDQLSKKVEAEKKINISLKGRADEVKFLEEIPGVKAVEPVDENRIIVTSHSDSEPEPDILKALVERGFKVMEMRPALPSLEEIYLKLISSDTSAGGES